MYIVPSSVVTTLLMRPRKVETVKVTLGTMEPPLMLGYRQFETWTVRDMTIRDVDNSIRVME